MVPEICFTRNCVTYIHSYLAVESDMLANVCLLNEGSNTKLHDCISFYL